MNKTYTISGEDLVNRVTEAVLQNQDADALAPAFAALFNGEAEVNADGSVAITMDEQEAKDIGLE